MAETTGLKIQKLPANPSEGDVQVNAGWDLLDAATQQDLTINFASDADLTLTTTGTIAQWQYSVIRLTDTGPVLTAARNVIVPVNKRTYRFINNTAQTLTVKTAAGTGIAVLASAGKMLQCDGTNVIDVLPGSGGGITDLIQDTTPQLGGTLDTNAKQIRESKGTDIASATTLTIPSDGNFFDVTGTTTITAFSAVAVGTEITLQFDGILTLTHSATDLILPTSANITTAAGDTAIFREYAAGDWLCVSYQKKNGESLAGTAASVLDMPVQSKSADYTLLAGDKGNLINVDATGAARTITLLAAATAGDGYTIAIKKTDASANTVTIDGSGAETIDGSATQVISAQYDALILTCNGTSWFILAEPAAGATGADLNAANTWTAGQRGEVTTLTSTTNSIAINLADSNNFSHTLTENTTLAAPSNAVEGQSGVITIIQDATTARTLAYNTFWKFEGGTVPAISTTLGSRSTFVYYVDDVGATATCNLIGPVS